MTPSTLTTAIERNSRQHEQALRQAERKLSDAHDTTLNLEHQILEGLRNLATLQLENPAALSSAVIDEMGKRREQEEILRLELGGVEQSISGVNECVRDVCEQIDSLKSQVKQALAVDRHYLMLLDAKERASEALGAYAPTDRDIQSECENKLVAYMADRAHMYLFNAKYGTSEYSSRFLVRYLDGWIARKVNFAANLNSHRMLLAMQKASSARRIELEASLGEAELELQTAEANALQAARMPQLLIKLENLRRDLVVKKSMANDVHRALGKYASKSDSHFQRAEELMLGSLKTKTFDEIKLLVSRSTNNLDDEVANKISKLQRELAAHHSSIPPLERARNEASEAYDRAKILERNMRSSYYTDSDYRYNHGLNLDFLILGYMASSITSDGFEREVKRYREEVPQQAATYSSSQNSSNGDSGGFRTTDSIGGSSGSSSGDFTTTDSV